MTTGKGSIVLSRQVPDEPMRLEEIYYNEVHSFCSVSSQPSTYYSTSPYVHSLPLFMALKKPVIGSFFLVNDECIWCLIAWDYTFLRPLNKGRFSLAERHSVCFTVIHTAVINIPGV